jgi:type I restriction enzyme M protein
MAVKDDFLPMLLTTYRLFEEEDSRPEATVAATISLFGIRVLAMAQDWFTELGVYPAGSSTWNLLVHGSYASLDEAIEELSGEIDVPALFHSSSPVIVRDDALRLAILNLDQLDVPIHSQKDFNLLNRAVDRFISEMARRKEVAAFATPEPFNALIAKLLLARREEDVASVYDPACGMGGTLIAVHEALVERGHGTKTHFHGMDVDFNATTVAAWRLLLRGVTSSTFEVDDVEANNMFRHDNQRFDIVAAVPPFYHTVPTDSGLGDALRIPSRVKPSGRRADYVFVQHAMNSIALGGRGAIAIALSALNRSGQDEMIRKNLVHFRMLEAVISLPDGAVPRLPAPPAVLLFDHDRSYRSRDALFFIAASGNRGASARPQSLDGETVERLAAIYKRHRNQVGSSALADLDTIKSHNYSLVPHLYITPEAIEVQGGRTLGTRIRHLEQEFAETAKALDEAFKKVGDAT